MLFAYSAARSTGACGSCREDTNVNPRFSFFLFMGLMFSYPTCSGPPRWIENEDDQDLVDKLKKESER
jgi:hypothetical protein